MAPVTLLAGAPAVFGGPAIDAAVHAIDGAVR
jgi:hypothetical protein